MGQKIEPEQLLIGAHTSTAGGVHNALIEGKSIDATTVQLFTSNQRQWKARKLTEEQIALFKNTCNELGLRSIMSHASYLLNLGSPDPYLLEKSRHAFREEIERSLQLGLAFVNFHPGAAIDDSREACLDRISASILDMEELFVGDELFLLLETTAGQGSTIGSSFEELDYILKKTQDRVPIGVCVDTAHIFAAGYEIRDAAGWTKTLAHFDKIIGLKNLRAFHLNDSATAFNSRKDRHANLGEGEIGLEAFKYLMRSPHTRLVPKYLETPGGCEMWDKEIWMLRECARETSR